MNISKSINSALNRTLGIRAKKTKDLETWINLRSTGMVEEFTNKHIIGWVSAHPSDFPIKISLHINAVSVISTWANVDSTHNTTGKVQSFYLPVSGIWDFCNKGDRLTVRIGGQILPIYGKGVYKRIGHNGAKNLKDLKKMLAKNYVFNNFGRLQLSRKFDIDWQNNIINLYRDVAAVLADRYNITPFLIYGSLLGQVREGGFIGHDPDFDIAYISKYQDGKSAAQELKNIALSLIDAGFLVEQKKTAIHIHSKDKPELKIDLFHLFFSGNNELVFPFGVAGTSKFTLSDWRGIEESNFSGHKVVTPKNAETLIEHIYGSSWRTPIAGFNWNHARTFRDKSGDVPESDRNEINQTNK